jgi:hypothetical protein
LAGVRARSLESEQTLEAIDERGLAGVWVVGGDEQIETRADRADAADAQTACAGGTAF